MPPNPQDPDSSAARKPGRKRQVVGLSPYQEKVLKKRLRKASPSEPWVEAQIKTTLDKDQNGREILYRYHDPHVFPPGGDETKMIRCPECGILMPPLAFEHGRCLDHARHDGWGPSPSAVTIRALQHRNLRLADLPLEPEDCVSLREEISNFKRKSSRKSKTARKL